MARTVVHAGEILGRFQLSIEASLLERPTWKIIVVILIIIFSIAHIV